MKHIINQLAQLALIIGLLITFNQFIKAQSALDGFDPNADGTVRAVAVQPDGKILIGGSFTTVLGVTRNRIARLNTDGTLDTAFNPNANNGIISIAVQPDGKILVGGNFTTIGGQPRRSIARLDAGSGLADSFDPSANGSVSAIVVQPDGRILAGGAFTTIGGQPRNFIARLNATTAFVDSFDANANGTVSAIALAADGKVLVGGGFTCIGGQPRNQFARLTNDTPALSALTVTRSALTLARDGSAPQFTRVIFEQSVDNGATYTSLGTATNSRSAFAGSDDGKIRLAAVAGDEPTAIVFAPAAPTASGYTLTGLNLPTNSNILIRARGFYSSGYSGGAEITEDKVQTAFLLAPTAAVVSISGKVTLPQELGLTNALVTLTDMRGDSRTILTGKFGSFRFTNVAAGETYIVTVTSRRYIYAPQVVTATEDVTEVNFTAQ